MDWISRMLVTFLVNSVVQVAIIAGLALLCSAALRHAAAKYQYVLWIAALLLSSLLPVWSLKSAISPAVSVRGHDTLEGIGQSKPGPGRPNDTIALGLWSRLSQRHEEQLSFPPTLTAVLASLYAAFLVYRVVCLGFAWRHTRKLYDAAGTHPASGTVRSLVERHAKAFRLKCAPRVYAPDGIGPLTVGVMQPLLLMPAKFLEAASEADFDSAVCHELAHISRRDFQMNLICELFSLGVSFHPAAWLMKSRINQTRELACDDLAAEKLSTPTLYAGALVHIAQSLLADSRNVSSSLAQGLFDTDDMERRISNLLDKRSRLGKTWERVLTLAMVGWLVGVTIGASAFSVQMTPDRRPAASSNEQSAQANDNSSRHRIRVSQITFVETTKTIDETEIQSFAREIEGLKELDQSWLEEVQERTRGFWQNRGYFKVKVEVSSKVVSDSPTEQVFSVSATVDPGSQYRLKNLIFTGATVFTPSELASMFPIKPGDIFSRERIARGLENLRSAYVTRGHKDFTCVPDTDFDDSNHTVTLRMEIDEGRPSK
jgi:beta-lactamase regulating signal transducer with metallopeptidase domain